MKYGIVQNHAYSVLRSHVIEPNIRLMYLKNPWGRCQWKGRFGPSDPVWSEGAIKANSFDSYHSNLQSGSN